MKHSHVALGGTFDRLHSGHTSLLSFAFRISKKVTIGLVTNELLSKKPHTAPFQIYAERKRTIETFLQKYSLLQRAHIVPLHDIYGPTLNDTSIEALVLTAETKFTGRKISTERKKRGLPLLKLYVVPFIKGDDRKIIRSERIREGLIDREGTYYASFFGSHRHLILPDTLRVIMRKPLGAIFSHERMLFRYLKSTPYTLLITVGDIVTQTLHTHSIIPDVSVVDYKTRRSRLQKPPETKNTRFIHNKPGSIQGGAVSAVFQAIKKALKHRKKSLVHINGEEDLLALPAILGAPLESLVIYGQYDLGIVVTPVTEHVKESVLQLLTQFHSG